jgi:MFS family permease
MSGASIHTAPARPPSSATLVIVAASFGTMFEWYDFFLYGSLASLIARHFFSGVNEATAFIFALAAFAAGFAVRPFGALVFGRIGDLVGRKNTFLVTMTIMGLATFMVGVLPDFDAIGAAAPAILVGLRLLQGLAIGGEYGGAAIYVAEHAPADRRGLHTSWINAMATLGLILSLLVIISCRLLLSEADFQTWGWRAPFLLSAALLGVSLWVRMKLQESPVFQRMKDESALSAAPLREVFGRWANLKRVLIALVGSIVGSTSMWYTAKFYAMFFIERVLKVDGLRTNILMVLALAVAAPSYVICGWLSDRIGRKPVMLAGCALAAVALFPLFHILAAAANPALAAAQTSSPVVVYADPAACSVQFDPVGANKFDARDCDIAKSFLTRAGVAYANVGRPAGTPTEIHVGARILQAPDPRGLGADARRIAVAAFQDEARAALAGAGYPAAADPARVNAPLVIAIVALLVILAAMTYAPGAAFLVELFPARIRYTAVSFPYHLGSGWVGGFLPASAFAIVTATGDIYAGLWYPVFFVAVSAIVGLIVLPETRGRAVDV